MGFLDKLFNSFKTEQQTNNGDSDKPASQTEPTAAPVQEDEVPATMNLKFGCPNPVAYLTEINGEPFAVYFKCFGTANLVIEDPEDVKAMGGTKRIEEFFKLKVVNSFAKAMMELCSEKVPPGKVPVYHSRITKFMMNDINEEISAMYRVKLDDFSINGITLTDESREAYKKAAAASKEN